MTGSFIVLVVIYEWKTIWLTYQFIVHYLQIAQLSTLPLLNFDKNMLNFDIPLLTVVKSQV